MKNSPTSLLLAVLSATTIITAPLRADLVLGNITQPWRSGQGFSPDVIYGFAFQSGPASGFIDGLSLSLISGSAATSQSITYTISLYSLDAGNVPSGAALSTDTGVTATWTNPVGGGNYQQQTFTYDSIALPNLFAYSLSQNSKYAITISDGSGLPAFEHYWAQAVNSAGYTTAGGFSVLGSVLSADAGDSWLATSFNSPTMEESPIVSLSFNANEPVVPEPGTWATGILLIGAGALYARRKRGNADRTHAS